MLFSFRLALRSYPAFLALAADLESALRSGSKGGAEYTTLSEEVAGKVEAVNNELLVIAAALPLVHAEPVGAGSDLKLSSQELQVLLNELDSLLARSDTAALKFCDTYGNVLHTNMSGSVARMLRAIKAFSFEEARRILQTLKNTLPD